MILEIRICPICGGVVNKTQVAQLKTFITNPVILGNLKNSPTLINTSIYSSHHRVFYASLIRGPFHKSLTYKRYPQNVTTILASNKLTAYRARIKEHFVGGDIYISNLISGLAEVVACVLIIPGTDS